MPQKRSTLPIQKRTSVKSQLNDPAIKNNQQPLLQKKISLDMQQVVDKKSKGYVYFEKIQLKNIIKELKEKGGIQRRKLQSLIDISQNILKYQPNVYRLLSPVTIVGDIHGQFFDLINIFQQNGYPDKTKFLFLGDYVDRGLFCIEVITFLLVLKIKYPKNVFLLRGNHQGRVMTMNFNFRIQCQKKYGIQMYERFMELFNKLPLCAVIDQTYFAVHGGISPEITQIKELQKVNRFVDIQNKGVVCDLVWSDPSDNAVIQWETNAMRGCSYYYSKIQAKRFLKDNKIKMIIRGHQVQIEGYNYQKTNMDEKLTLTIFSAPNYCDSYKNKGAVAIVHNNKISIQRFSQVAHPFVLANYMDCLQFSIPGVCQLVGKLLIFLIKNKRKSRKSSMIDDNILQELNALQRIQGINQLFQKKLIQFQQALQQSNQRQQQTVQITVNLAKSYQIAYQLFVQKKQNDEQQKYPDENLLKTLKQNKRIRRATLRKDNNEKQNIHIALSKDKDQAFGPKLHMANNINKKLFFQQQTQLEGQEE